MKAFKPCRRRFLGRHLFQILSKTVRIDFVPSIVVGLPGSHLYERVCTRCGLHQKISTTFGLHFLEEETGGK